MLVAVLSGMMFTASSHAQSLLQQIIQDAQQKEGLRQQQIQQQQWQQQQLQQQQQEMLQQQQAAQTAKARRAAKVEESWKVVDPYVRLCVDRRLQGAGQSVQMLIKVFVPASDERVQELLQGCNPISYQRLLKKTSCTVEGTPSLCNEEYVFTDFPTTPLTADQLVTAYVGGRAAEVGTTQFEDPQAKTKRLEQVEARRRQAIANSLQAKLASLAVPENTFSFKNASNLQKTIAAGAANPKTKIEQLELWSAEVDRLVEATKNEEMRLEQQKADMLARGEIAVAASGTGANAKVARINAYFDIFLVQLRSMLGEHANSAIGDQFRKTAEGDVDRFRATYFTSDTRDSCSNGKGPVRCDVKGTFKVNVLKVDVQKLMQATLGTDKHSYRFILRYPPSGDETTGFLIAQISAAFINSGYQIISKSAEEEAEAKGDFDFYLNVLEISYDSAQDAGADFITYNLKARVKLINRDNDAAKQEDLANVPVINTKRVPRDPRTPLAARSKELLQIQGNELARTILQEVDSRLLALQGQLPAPPGTAATAGAVTQYSVHIAGLAQARPGAHPCLARPHHQNTQAEQAHQGRSRRHR